MVAYRSPGYKKFYLGQYQGIRPKTVGEGSNPSTPAYAALVQR